jgi:hypothetical protein
VEYHDAGSARGSDVVVKGIFVFRPASVNLTREVIVDSIMSLCVVEKEIFTGF